MKPIILSLAILFFCDDILNCQVLIPVRLGNRRNFGPIELTAIGSFGLVRVARATVPEHFHTGIDIKRPGKNYESEPIFAIATGIVISKRTDGPYSNIIIEHLIKGKNIWTVYEHVAGIRPGVGDKVTPFDPIARFMTREELDRYGWQFDHFHLEIIRVKPRQIKPTSDNPGCHFLSYTLICHTREELDRFYYDPVTFLKNNL
ncbi:MAG: M23 family metallopeptidase [Bacteroidales bacterium]